MTNEIKNETIDKWAADMLQIIDNSLQIVYPGGIGGLGSEDGIYVGDDEAAAITKHFDLYEDDYIVWSMGMSMSPVTAISHKDDATKCLLIALDDEFPEERRMNWYDEAKF